MPRNELICVLDSVGWTQVNRCRPNFCEIGDLHRATAPSFWTLPSAHSILYGCLPICEVIPFKLDWKSLPRRFKEKGYNTYLLTSHPWISSTYQHLAFEHEMKLYQDMSSPQMVDWFLENYKEPFFALFWFTETHFPYGDNTPEAQRKMITFLDEQINRLACSLTSTRFCVTSDHSEIFHDDGRLAGHDPQWEDVQPRIVELLDVFLCIFEV